MLNDNEFIIVTGSSREIENILRINFISKLFPKSMDDEIYVLALTYNATGEEKNKVSVNEKTVEMKINRKSWNVEINQKNNLNSIEVSRENFAKELKKHVLKIKNANKPDYLVLHIPGKESKGNSLLYNMVESIKKEVGESKLYFIHVACAGTECENSREEERIINQEILNSSNFTPNIIIDGPSINWVR